MLGPMSDFPLKCASLSIDLGDRRYDILIGAGLLGDAASFEGLPGGSQRVRATCRLLAFLRWCCCRN